MITDEQVLLADNIYTGRHLLSTDLTSMRKALEAYEASKWVKFDVDDETTHPPRSKYDNSNSDNLLINVNDEVIMGSFDLYRKRMTFTDVFGDVHTPSHWQYLPEFKE